GSVRWDAAPPRREGSGSGGDDAGAIRRTITRAPGGRLSVEAAFFSSFASGDRWALRCLQKARGGLSVPNVLLFGVFRTYRPCTARRTVTVRVGGGEPECWRAAV